MTCVHSAVRASALLKVALFTGSIVAPGPQNVGRCVSMIRLAEASHKAVGRVVAAAKILLQQPRSETLVVPSGVGAVAQE